MDRWDPKHVELTHVMNKLTQNFVYLVGLHIYYKMIHGSYNIKVKYVNRHEDGHKFTVETGSNNCIYTTFKEGEA